MAPTPAQRRLLELAQGFRTAAVVITFAELGIAERLAAGPLASGTLAASVGADPAALERFLRAAALLELVRETAAGWELTPLAAETLVPDSPHSLARFLANQAAFYRRWGLLSEAVRSGRAPEASRREEDADSWVRRFTLMLYEVARTTSEDIAAVLLPLLEGIPRPRVLDLGGCHGEYLMALARAREDLEGVVFDLPPVIAVTRELIASQGLADRVQAVAGDFFRDPIGSGYQLVLLFGVLNGMGPDQAQQLLGQVHQALAPGGWLAIRATPPDAPPAARLQHALLDLQMLLATDRGHNPTAEELEQWLTAAGFASLAWRAVDETTALLLGRRSER